jgi:hypothetical protein
MVGNLFLEGALPQSGGNGMARLVHPRGGCAGLPSRFDRDLPIDGSDWFMTYRNFEASEQSSVHFPP